MAHQVDIVLLILIGTVSNLFFMNKLIQSIGSMTQLKSFASTAKNR